MPGETHQMIASECLRKLAQLHPVLCVDDQSRIFVADDVAQSDLALFVRPDGSVDSLQLVPFLVVAVNHLAERLEKMKD